MSLLSPCNVIWDGTLCFEINQLCPSFLSKDASKTLAGQGSTHMLAMFVCVFSVSHVCWAQIGLQFSLHMQNAPVYVLEGSRALRTYMLAFRRHKIRYTHIQDSHMAREAGHAKQMQQTAIYFRAHHDMHGYIICKDVSREFMDENESISHSSRSKHAQRWLVKTRKKEGIKQTTHGT
jgi:hypothetical protein